LSKYDLTAKKKKSHALIKLTSINVIIIIFIMIIIIIIIIIIITMMMMMMLRRNPTGVRVTSGQKLCTEIICIVLQTSVRQF